MTSTDCDVRPGRRTPCRHKARHVLEVSIPPNVVITRKYIFYQESRHNALIVFSDIFTRTNSEMSHEKEHSHYKPQANESLWRDEEEKTSEKEIGLVLN